MSEFTWSRDYEVGIPFVDADHKILFGLFIELTDLLAAHEEWFLLEAAARSVLEYAGFHFAREETLLRCAGSSDWERHAQSHRIFFDRISSFCRECQERRDSFTESSIAQFILEWKVNHLFTYDLQMGTTCKDRPAAVATATALHFHQDHDGPPAARENGGTDWSRLSVLLVEDNPHFLTLMEKLLRAAGVRNVRKCRSAEEGMHQVLKRVPDVVICDWFMDGTDGPSFVRELRQLGIPSGVVMLTGQNVHPASGWTGLAGIDHYLTKPASCRDILAGVAQAAAIGIDRWAVMESRPGEAALVM